MYYLDINVRKLITADQCEKAKKDIFNDWDNYKRAKVSEDVAHITSLGDWYSGTLLKGAKNKLDAIQKQNIKFIVKEIEPKA